MLNLTARHALLSDIDLSLLPSTSLDIQPWQQELIISLEGKLGGALAMITGRGMESVDKVFPGVAASVEQHAAWRAERGAQLQALGKQMNVDEIVEKAAQALTGKVRMIRSLADLPYVKNAVFIERKQFSLALIFTDVADAATKDIVKSMANKVMKSNLDPASFGVKVGSDSVEIGPKGVDKGVAVRDFMATAAFQGRIPVYIGDGPTDEAAMRVVKELGGLNIAVGDLIKDESLIDLRVAGIDDAWNILKAWDQKLSLS